MGRSGADMCLDRNSFDAAATLPPFLWPPHKGLPALRGFSDATILELRTLSVFGVESDFR